MRWSILGIMALSLGVVIGCGPLSNQTSSEKPVAKATGEENEIEFTLILQGNAKEGWTLNPYRNGKRVAIGSSGQNMTRVETDTPPPFAGLWSGSLEPPDNPVYCYYRSTLKLGANGSAEFVEYLFDTAKGVDRTTETGRDAPFEKKLAVKLNGRWWRHPKREGAAVLMLRPTDKLNTNTPYWRELE